MAVFNKSNTVSKEISTTTIISKQSRLKGEFHFKARLFVEGEMEGRIISNNIVVVAKNGVIKGDIKSDRIIINGTVKGVVYAKDVEVTKNGVLEGEVITNNLVVEKGGVFKGTSKIEVENNAG